MKHVAVPAFQYVTWIGGGGTEARFRLCHLVRTNAPRFVLYTPLPTQQRSAVTSEDPGEEEEEPPGGAGHGGGGDGALSPIASVDTISDDDDEQWTPQR